MFARRNKPDFVIIGAQKGGTTTLYDLLSQHPEINPAKKKEVHYFDLNYHQSLKWYYSFFSGGKITGEASPYYLFHPLVPERMKRVLPAVKLMVLLRNPVDRAYSHHNMEWNRGIETLPFEVAIEMEEYRLKGEIEKLKEIENYGSQHYQYFSYLARGKYYSQVKEWFEHFNREQFLFIQSEVFFSEPQMTLNKICNFLEIESFNFKMDISMKGNYANKLSASTRLVLNEYFKVSNIELYNLLNFNYNW